VTFLAHDSCPVSGQVFSVGGGRVSHVFIAETKGYFNPALTPEDVRDNWDTITDRADYLVPSSVPEEIGMFVQAMKD
jgi:hypothetical protein